MFYDRGRAHELESLEEQYEREGFSFVVIYGRRRVGKTSTISEFIRRGDKRAIRFTATENTNSVNMEGFSKSVFSMFPRPSSQGGFPSWEGAMDYIVERAGGERLVLSIDEYPYLAKAYPPLSSELQRHIDLVLKDTNIMLILCGSSMSFMERQVLGYQSPLYGRRTAQLRVDPLDYLDSAEFFGDACAEDKLLGYAVTGGVPQHLSTIAEAGTVEKGIAASFFRKKGLLYEEPYNLLKQELRQPATYNAIIGTVANGATRMNEIASKTGMEGGAAAVYVKNLVDLGILEKEAPMFAKDNRNGVYRIKDGMYRFWYRFVPGAVTLIDAGDERVYEDLVRPSINDFMGPAFEDICKQYLMRLNLKREMPFIFNRIGRWWGGNPVTKRETEIDIVASSPEGGRIVMGECKWRNREAGRDVYESMRDNAVLFPDKDVHYYIFSKSGFTPGLEEEAERNERLTLVGINDLFRA
ncbi:MAG: ATP-binding protein [Methanomassiliicoccaceae archaeon]|nr:ATP-binding protein [Methanomassiliicoccaceae archaeon]